MDDLIDKLIAAVRADDYDTIASVRAAIDDCVEDIKADAWDAGYNAGFGEN